jgi:hypothetical protein
LFILAASLIVVAAASKWIEVRQAPDDRCICNTLTEKVAIVHEVSHPVEINYVRLQCTQIVETVGRAVVGKRL